MRNDVRRAGARLGAAGWTLLALTAAGCSPGPSAPGDPPPGFPAPPPDPVREATPYGPRPEGTLTFNRDIAPIVFENCSPCHRPGEAAPFTFLSYEDVRRRGMQIVDVTASRYMPPWLPSPGYNEFVEQRGLTDDEIGLLRQWVTEGMREGDPADLPPAPTWTPGWQLGEPDLVLRVPEPYTLIDAGQDVFRNFVIPTYLPVDRHVAAIEFRADNRSVVHHAEFRIDLTRGSRRMDENDPGPGYEGMFFENVGFPDGHFLGWAPGRQASRNPDDMAWTLRRDADVVMQLHLQPSGRPETVQPRIGFFFTERPPAHSPIMVRLGLQDMDIPAGEPEYTLYDSYRVPVDVEVLSIFPHAHYLGKDMQAWAVLPDGSKRWLLRIEDWDFNWQDQYRYREPIRLPAGSMIAMRYTYDNTEDNIRNPSHPPRRVLFGPNSTDEMSDLWIQLLARPEDHQALDEHYRKWDQARLVALYEGKIATDPDSPFAHNVVAQELLRNGQLDEAIAHLEAALQSRPDHVLTRNNLAMALARRGETGRAEQQLRQALATDPESLEARLNLAQLLESEGRHDEAIAEYRLAVEVGARDPDSHFLLGRALERAGDPAGAVRHFRRAMELEPSWIRPLNSAAWLLATNPDGRVRDPRAALELAERAAELTGGSDALVQETLAAAYASSGRFDDAVAVARAALPLTDDASLRRRLERGIAMYGDGIAPSDP